MKRPYRITTKVFDKSSRDHIFPLATWSKHKEEVLSQLIDIFSPKWDEKMKQATKDNKMPSLSSPLLEELTPFLQIYTKQVQEKITENLGFPGSGWIWNLLQKGLKNKSFNKSSRPKYHTVQKVNFESAFQDYREQKYKDNLDVVFEGLGVELYHNTQYDVKYFMGKEYLKNFDNIKRLYKDTDDIIWNKIRSYQNETLKSYAIRKRKLLELQVQEDNICEQSYQEIDEKKLELLSDNLAEIQKVVLHHKDDFDLFAYQRRQGLQNLLKELFLEYGFSREDRNYNIIAPYIIKQLNKALQKGSKKQREIELFIGKPHIDELGSEIAGMRAEVYGDLCFKNIQKVSGNNISVQEYPLDKKIRDKLNAMCSTDGVYILTTDTDKEIVCLVDFKNRDSLDNIGFGDDIILDMGKYLSLDIDEEDPIQAIQYPLLKKRQERAQRMEKGAHEFLHISKPVKLLVIKVNVIYKKDYSLAEMDIFSKKLLHAIEPLLQDIPSEIEKDSTIEYK